MDTKKYHIWYEMMVPQNGMVTVEARSLEEAMAITRAICDGRGEGDEYQFEGEELEIPAFNDDRDLDHVDVEPVLTDCTKY